MKRWRMAAEALGLLSSLCTILAGVYSAHFIANGKSVVDLTFYPAIAAVSVPFLFVRAAPMPRSLSPSNPEVDAHRPIACACRALVPRMPASARILRALSSRSPASRVRSCMMTDSNR